MASVHDTSSAENQGTLDIREKDLWVLQAWQLWCNGVTNYRALGRQFNKTGKTVKGALQRHARQRDLVHLEQGLTSARSAYIDGLNEDLTSAKQGLLKLITDGDPRTSNAVVGTRKLIMELREKIAAALGVITRRSALEFREEEDDDRTPEQLAAIAGEAAIRAGWRPKELREG